MKYIQKPKNYTTNKDYVIGYSDRILKIYIIDVRYKKRTSILQVSNTDE